MRTAPPALAAALLLPLACGPDPGPPDAALRGAELPPVPGFDFTLADAHGRPFRFAEESRGHATLLFFGYASCPDVCPVHLTNLAAALERVPIATRRRVKVVFVTTDPERDTPERLRAWLGGFDPTFVGLRGPIERVNAIQATLGLPPAVREPPRAGEGYAVGHAAQLVAFSADGRRRAAYPSGTRQADWAHDLPILAAGSPDAAPAAGG